MPSPSEGSPMARDGSPLVTPSPSRPASPVSLPLRPPPWPMRDSVPVDRRLLPFCPRILLRMLQVPSAASLLPVRAGGSSVSSSLPFSPLVSLGPSLPLSVSLRCALLFVDISGFSVLTESMVRSGSAGLEELTVVVNAYFTSVLECIERYGGDLLKIAGDALIVLFPTERDSGSESEESDAAMAAVCGRALECAMELQASHHQPTVGLHTLQQHIAVTAGRTELLLVGGTEQDWEGVQRKSRDSCSPGSPSPLLCPTPAAVASADSQAAGSSLEPSLHLRDTCSASLSGDERYEFLAVGEAFEDLAACAPLSKAGEIAVSATAAHFVQRLAVGGKQRYSMEAVGGSSHFKVAFCPSGTAAQTDKEEVRGDEQKQDREDAEVGELTSLPEPPSTVRLSLASFLMPALLWSLQSSSSSVLSSPRSPLTRCSSSSSLASSSSSSSPSSPFHSASAGPAVGWSSSSWLAEYRHVTVLFMSLPLPDCSQASWLASFNSLFLLIQQSVLSSGGQIRQLLCDDKGCICIAVFGLPPLCYENDAIRGVTAALLIQQRVSSASSLRQSAADVRMGITTGRAYCGFVGSRHRRGEYVVLGDMVNLSARLMSAAGKSERRLLADEHTMRDTSKRIEWVAGEMAVPVKGKAELVTVYSPVELLDSSHQPTSTTPRRLPGSRCSRELRVAPLAAASSSPSLLSSPSTVPAPHSSSSPSTLSAGTPSGTKRATGDAGLATAVGREDTYEVLTGLLQRLSSDQQRQQPVIVITADAGFGKSFLTRRLLSFCTATNITVLLGVADEMQQTMPYAPFVSIISHVLDTHVRHSATLSTEDALLEMLPASDRPWLPLLQDVLPALELRMEDAQELEESERPTYIRRLLLSLLHHHFHSDPRSLLLIEDVHWLDAQSWALLHVLLSSHPEIAIYLTTRPPDGASIASAARSTAADIKRVLAAPRTRQLQLDSFEQQHCTALAQQLVGGCSSLSPRLQRLIFERTEGVPLFIVQLLPFMVDCQIIHTDSLTGQADMRVRSAAASGDGPSSTSLPASELLPGSLEALLASVLDRLDSRTQFVMKVASVVGRTFHSKVLCMACPQPAEGEGEALTEEQLLLMLEHAREKQVIRDLRGDTASGLSLRTSTSVSACHGLSFQFVHQLVRDAAYNSLLFSQRRELHASVAAALRSLYQSTDKDVSATVSIQSLANHYWLAVSTSPTTVMGGVRQPLLLAATEHILLSARASIKAGAEEPAIVSLVRAIRCIRSIEHTSQQHYWELRWFTAWVGSQLMLSSALLNRIGEELAADTPGMRPAMDAPYLEKALAVLRPAAERLLHLLLHPTSDASRGLSAKRVQKVQFAALICLWYCSVVQGPAASVEQSRLLWETAQAATGPDGDYYRLEAVDARVLCTNAVNDVASYLQLLNALPANVYYQQLLDGTAKLTRVAIGYSAMAKLPAAQAAHQWRFGRFVDALSTLQRHLAVLPNTTHPASITFGNAYALRVVFPYGRHPTTLHCLQHIIHNLPDDDEPANRMWGLLRKVALIVARAWQSGSPELAEGEEETLLSIIRTFTTDGRSFGSAIIAAVTTLPCIADYPLDLRLPLSCLAAFNEMAVPYPRFACGIFDSETRRRRAVAAIQQAQQPALPPTDRLRLMAVAERELLDAWAATHDVPMLRLKVVDSWCELWTMQGKAVEAKRRLQAELAHFADHDAAAIKQALRTLNGLEEAVQQRGEGKI